MPTNHSFRSKFAFGKRIEAYVKGLMLKEGLDVYTPEVDDDAVDFVVKSPKGHYVEIQVKAMSQDPFFAGISHQLRPNYWFVFYSESMHKFWLLSSEEFLKEATPTQTGKPIGTYSIKFNGTKKGVSYVLPKFEKYEISDFIRVIQ